MSKQQRIGYHAESQTLNYLKQQGLRFITRNYSCKYGEIDLIMKEKNIIVFVEVRYRKKQNYGAPIETISIRKCKRLTNTAIHYLTQHQLYATVNCRFDIVGLTSNQSPIWLKNAIEIL